MFDVAGSWEASISLCARIETMNLRKENARPRNVLPTSRRQSQASAAGSTLRFVESLLSLLRMHRDHELIFRLIQAKLISDCFLI